MQLTGKEINRNNRISLGVTVFSFMVLLLFLMFKNIIGSNPNIANISHVEVSLAPGNGNPYDFTGQVKTSGLIAGNQETGSQKKVAVSDEQISIFSSMTSELLEKYKAGAKKNETASNKNEQTGHAATLSEKKTEPGINGNEDLLYGFNLEKRQLLSGPQLANEAMEEGKVIVEIIVDKVGNVIEANPNGRGTTTSNSKLKAQAKQMALETKFSPAPGIEEQRGTITINFSFH